MKKITLFLIVITLLFSTRVYAQIDRLLIDKQIRNGFISFAKIRKDTTPLVLSVSTDFLKEITGIITDISFAKTTIEIPINS